MKTEVSGEFGVEGGYKKVALANQYRMIGGE
jgi:hypothetical protein